MVTVMAMDTVTAMVMATVTAMVMATGTKRKKKKLFSNMLTWFSSKKKHNPYPLLEGMTDVHAHLLPNMDGGSESLMDSIAALERMKGSRCGNGYF